MESEEYDLRNNKTDQDIELFINLTATDRTSSRKS